MMTLFYLCLLPVLTRGHVITDYLQDVRNHKADVDRILDYIQHGAGRHQTYSKAANITDMFGPRLSGSHTLEDAADYLIEMMKNEGLENVHSEPVLVPHWVRGEEVVQVLQPRNLHLSVLGLGGSVGTNGSDIIADVIVVESFEELTNRQQEVAGKIVVFNQAYETYFSTAIYRTQGASYASQYGAVAALVRSITDFSIYSPHTGTQWYWSNVTKIPALSITVEDAETIYRWHKAGVPIQISISSTSESLGMSWSKNVMAEIVGTHYPDQVVVFGGHLDSWDVGSGAMDDATEVVMSWQVLSIIKALGLKPKRTMRMLAWTAEEVGLHGAKEYYKQHKAEANMTSLMMESDYGLFTPEKVHFQGSQESKDIIEAVLNLMGDSRLPVFKGGVGADIGPWIKDGVPTLSLETDHEKYFYYHHSNGDSISVYTPADLDKCTQVWATLAYVIADLDILLPRVTSEEYHHMQHGIPSGGKKAAQWNDVTVTCILLAVSMVPYLDIF